MEKQRKRKRPIWEKQQTGNNLMEKNGKIEHENEARISFKEQIFNDHFNNQNEKRSKFSEEISPKMSFFKNQNTDDFSEKQKEQNSDVEKMKLNEN